MKILIIDAGPNPESTTSVGIKEFCKQLSEEGVDSEVLFIGDQPIARCTLCGACAKNDRCAIDDIVNVALEKGESADGFVFATQGHFGVANGYLAAFMHRFLNTSKFYLNKPVASIVTCRRTGGTSTLAELNAFYTMRSMPIVSSTYWPVLMGANPDAVKQDAEGLKTMRNLARNMAWMVKSIDAGKKAGIAAVKPE